MRALRHRIDICVYKCTYMSSKTLDDQYLDKMPQKQGKEEDISTTKLLAEVDKLYLSFN